MPTKTNQVLEENTIKESVNPRCVVYLDTGKRDSEGRKVFRNLDTGIEQVFEEE